MAGIAQGPFDGSGASLVDFLSYAMQCGLVPPQTGANYIVACKDVLPVLLGEEWQTADVTSLDMAAMRRRLRAAKGDRELARFDGQLVPALAEFRAHLGRGPAADQPDKKAKVARPTRGKKGAAPRPPDPARGTSGAGDAEVESPRPPDAPPEPEEPEVQTPSGSPAPPNLGVIPHLFPLREGLLAMLLLPADLNTREARRLAAFIESLAIPDAPDVASAPVESQANGSGAEAATATTPPGV